ncbi:NAD(P)/FAD-dependent oxidoreductase [Bosea sp. SSUT16]|jgi:NADH dehydrogenase|uniref:NAD(P)/FAD-dependent oxidoreductase n=1 Tax=Bosea spartocytisi TaxID=2773451 RepID=A0A927E7P3_9HYPH|nr:NAD(P)/FAD-dependent oxidoreductase [Bosea spartocytisi]MBD3845747.1 NAD(P)/FAD-dependent oxidoreductase [Bosea spartocytisi]MCT4473040.1 NAD(P)/FAD-dependent oxidoreductase [Bosea spartocytisi]
MTAAADHHVVIVGAGFGGLEAARHLAPTGLRITVIDRRNHHLFQPLLYQVATASLPTSEIAWPARSLLRRYKNVTTLLGTVVGIDKAGKTVLLEGEQPIAFDTLIVATGARHAYFGRDEWEPYAPGLKTLEDATRIRRRILSAFEQAEWEPDEAARAPFLTFAIIGAGPTGVELAGTIAELAHDTLRGDFRNFDTRSARVVLIEAGPRILAGFTPDLSAYAERALARLGVEIRLGHPVSQCGPDGVELGGEFLAAKTILWAAGVAASPAAEWLGAPADRAGRVRVEPDLSVPGDPAIFVIGDTAAVEGADGKPVPGVAPAAKQEGGYVAGVIKARLAGKAPLPPFAYKNAGNLATIGKRAAIVDFGWIKLRGRLAWWIWGVAHIFFLIGLRNRIAVSLNWLWIYFTGHRSARLITQGNTGTPRQTE